MNYEAHYWVRTQNSDVIYLGEFGGPIPSQLLTNNLTPFINTIALNYGELLAINAQFKPENNAEVTSSIGLITGNLIIINFWLANTDPIMTCEYLNKNPASAKIKMNVEAHCWKLGRAAHIVDIQENLAFIINKFKTKEKIFKEDTLLRFIMYMDDPYGYPYIYGYFRPLNQVTVCKEKLLNVPVDEYKIEFCNTYQGHYFSINKSKYDSDHIITVDDLKFLK